MNTFALLRALVVLVGAILSVAVAAAITVDPARREAAVKMSASDRLTISRAFSKKYGHSTNGIVEFIEFIVNSNRITDQGTGGSVWWRGVDGLMVLDMVDADRALSTGVTKVDSKYVQNWINFALFRKSVLNRLRPDFLLVQQQLWWTAHQTSLHAGIRAFEPELKFEPASEFALLSKVVIPNVDLVSFFNVPTYLGAIKLFTVAAYPKTYPSSDAEIALAVATAPASLANIFGLSNELTNVGLNSTRWD